MNNDTADTTLTPQKLLESKKAEEQRLRQEKFDYYNQIFDKFIDKGELPTVFKEIFDWDGFWESLQEWDEGEDTEYVAKAKLILQERNQLHLYPHP